MINNLLIIGLGGFLGSVLRYSSQQFLQRLFDTVFPIGTMTVNILGSFIIGVVYALAERYQWMTPEWRLFLAVGFCGGFTTFSSFSFELQRMLGLHEIMLGGIYLIGSVVLGVAATILGIWIIRLF